MKKKKTVIFFFALCIFSLMSVHAEEVRAAQVQPNHLRTYLRQGIDKVFNMEPHSANASLQKAVQLDREDPTGYAFLTLTHLVFYEMSYDEKERKKNQDAMLRYANDTRIKGEKRIEQNPQDGQAYFALALAKIAKIRWALTRKEYLTVAQETSSIWNYLEKARTLAPHNYDVYFLMGILHYHIDNLPDITRFFSSLLITSGDRKKGVYELELASQKGDLLKEIAQAELAQIYMNFEKKPARALPIVQGLRNKFPRNYNFSFALANTLSDLHRFKEAFVIAREIEKGIQTCIPPFVPQLKSRHDQLMGRIFFSQGDYVKAAEYCRMALKDTSSYNARVRVWAFVRLGMIHDARKEREEAEDYYIKALHVEGGEGVAQVEARNYLKTPYVPPPRP